MVHIPVIDIYCPEIALYFMRRLSLAIPTFYEAVHGLSVINFYSILILSDQDWKRYI